MAERSDAVIIVVSEETGSISIAYDFSFVRDVSVDELKKFLQEHVLRIHLDDSDLQKSDMV